MYIHIHIQYISWFYFNLKRKRQDCPCRMQQLATPCLVTLCMTCCSLRLHRFGSGVSSSPPPEVGAKHLDNSVDSASPHRWVVYPQRLCCPACTCRSARIQVRHGEENVQAAHRASITSWTRRTVEYIFCKNMAPKIPSCVSTPSSATPEAAIGICFVLQQASDLLDWGVEGFPERGIAWHQKVWEGLSNASDKGEDHIVKLKKSVWMTRPS